MCKFCSQSLVLIGDERRTHLIASQKPTAFFSFLPKYLPLVYEPFDGVLPHQDFLMGMSTKVTRNANSCVVQKKKELIFKLTRQAKAVHK